MSSSGCSYTRASFWRPQPKAACDGDYLDDDDDDDNDVYDDNDYNDGDDDDDGIEDCLHTVIFQDLSPSIPAIELQSCRFLTNIFNHSIRRSVVFLLKGIHPRWVFHAGRIHWGWS